MPDLLPTVTVQLPLYNERYVATRLLHADFIHSVKRLATRNDHVDTGERLLNALDIADLDEQPRAMSAVVRNEARRILLDALVRLIHHLDGVLREDHESKAIAFGHFGCLGEAQSLPE